MFKYRGVNFLKTVYRPYAPLISSLFFVGFSDRASWREFIGLNYKLQDALEIDGIFYYPDYHLQTFAGRAVKHILKDRRNFLYLQRQTLKREKAILARKKRFDWGGLFSDYLRYQPTLALYHICDDFIEDRLRQALAKKLPAAKVDQLMSHLNLPLRLNLDQAMKAWFLKTEDIAGFIKKYSWNFSRFGQHRWLTPQEAKKFLHSIKKDRHLNREIRKRRETKQAIKEAKKALGRKAFYVDVMQFFIYYRTQRTDILNKVFFNNYDRLVEHAKRLRLSYSDLINCSYEEVRTGKIPDRKILSQRRRGTVACFSHGQIRIVSGPEVKRFQALCREKKSSNVLKGRTAWPGNVKARVKVVHGPQDFAGFRAGDILVASMTTPAMMPIMKKAAAFVTDEGGITCHAAILARELKKPCVISTKNARRVLRDGDWVEVDADQGVVKIIK